MNELRYLPIVGKNMRTYVFRVELTKEDDGRWSARAPALLGCATCGESQEEALQNIRDAVELYISDMQKTGEDIPKDATLGVINEPAVAVTV